MLKINKKADEEGRENRSQVPSQQIQGASSLDLFHGAISSWKGRAKMDVGIVNSLALDADI